MGEKYGPDKNHKIVLTPIEKYFIAIEGESHLVFPESMLTLSNIPTIIKLLNDAGFSLGTGHDGYEISKNGEGNYVLLLSPYIGHMDQIIIFKEK